MILQDIHRRDIQRMLIHRKVIRRRATHRGTHPRGIRRSTLHNTPLRRLNNNNLVPAVSWKDGKFRFLSLACIILYRNLIGGVAVRGFRSRKLIDFKRWHILIFDAGNFVFHDSEVIVGVLCAVWLPSAAVAY
ncbi:hypothetical protein ACJIZ3_001243 [Penstemon smallii]|uniref:Uncharacterized protein n=1 Tax=Penstemon smallii TaxID=265156 RepID=A0ABD3U4A7_9LAMI